MALHNSSMTHHLLSQQRINSVCDWLLGQKALILWLSLALNRKDIEIPAWVVVIYIVNKEVKGKMLDIKGGH